MLDVFLAFDVEDPIHPESDDALLRLARDLTAAGVPGCFFLVGEKARLLRERGRRDVLAALADHEIDYHGNYWFEFPELAMVTGERLSWEDAVQKALEIELPGLHDVAQITGRFPVAWCQHQGNTSPQTACALRLAGLKCWNGGFGGGGDPLWTMDSLTLSRAGHAVSLQGRHDGFQADPLHPERRPAACDPEDELAAFQRAFDSLAETEPGHIVCLGHPTCWVTAEWWGWYEWAGIFRQRPAEAPYPRGRRFERVPLRSPADAEARFQFTARAAQWLASRGDVRVTTFAQAAEEYAEPRGAWLSRRDLSLVADRLAERLDWVEAGGAVLSAADALYLLAHAMTVVLETGRPPDEVQVARVLGPTEPLLRPDRPVTLTRQDLLTGARDAYHQMLNTGRVPSALRVHYPPRGPAELARGLALAWQHLERACSLPEQVEVPEGPALPACVDGPFFSRNNVASTNAPPGFTVERIGELARLQSWSYRPARKREA